MHPILSVHNLPPENPIFGRADAEQLISSRLTNFSETSRVQKGFLQSGNFVTGSAGWQILATGDVEFNSGVFRGSLVAGSIDIPDTTTASSFHVNTTGDAWWGATTIGSAVAKILATGAATLTNATITGGALTGGTVAGFTASASALTIANGGNTVIVSSGATAFTSGPTGSPTTTITQAGVLTTVSAAIGGFNVGADYFRDVADSFGLASTVTGGDDVRFWAGDTFANRATADFIVTEAGAVTAASITITGGSVATSTFSGLIGQANINIANGGWTLTSAFTITDADTVAWGAGDLVVANGTTYSVAANNTGNMAAKTYIYMDIGTSVTELQTSTTSSDAVGSGKLLIAVAENATAEATFMLMNDNSYSIDAANIISGSITANEIAAGTITATEITVSSLSSLSAAIGTVTSGTVTGATLQTDAGATTGIKIDSTSLRGYDASNNVTFELVKATGVVTAKNFIRLVNYTAGEAITANNWVWLAGDSKLYLSDAFSGDIMNRVVGVASENAAADATCAIQETGSTTYVPAITTSSIYYVQDGTTEATNTPATNNGGAVIYTTEWKAQSFLIGGTDRKITSIRLQLSTFGSPTGTVTISLRATSSNLPTGADLATATIPVSSLTGTDTEYGLMLTTPVTLSASTTYTIVARGSGGDGSNYVVVFAQGGGSTYADGQESSSANSGSTWSAAASVDWWFKVNYGTGTIGTIAGTVTKKAGVSVSTSKLLMQVS